MRLLIILFAVFLTIPFCIAQEYYADVVIEVEDNGIVTIQGNSNHPALNTQATPDLTSKDGRYWLFNISTEEEFSSFIYRLNLPENTEINYLNTPGLSRIEHTNSGLSVIGTGENTRFFVAAQYSIDYKGKTSIIWYMSVGLLIVAGLAFLFLFKKKEPLPPLTQRQAEIYKIIEKNKNPLTQKEIQEKSGLPKASVSRNIETLAAKGVIKKEVRGISNVISVVPSRSGLFRQK